MMGVLTYSVETSEGIIAAFLTENDAKAFCRMSSLEYTSTLYRIFDLTYDKPKLIYQVRNGSIGVIKR